MNCMRGGVARYGQLLLASLLLVVLGAGCGGKHGLSGSPNSGSDALPAVNLEGWTMPDLADVVPPVPSDLHAVRERLAPYSQPLDPTAREASGVIKTLPGSSLGVSQSYPNPGYFDFRVSTPFNAQSPAQFFVNGSLTVSGLRTDRFIQIGLVTNAVYNYAMDPDGNPGTNDANPAYLFNQSALMLFANDMAGNPFAAPFDYNGTGGIGQAQPVPGTGFSFSLRLTPTGPTGGNVALKINSGAYGPDLQYRKNNWGWWPDEDYSQARLIAMVYSYNSNASPLNVSFGNIVADDPAYNPTGSDWVHTYGGASQEIGGSVAVDASGNVYVGGTNSTGSLLIQFTAAGALGWRKTWNAGAGGSIYDIAIGSDGNIYCANDAAGLLKYAPDGTLLMQRSISGMFTSGICVDSSNNIYCTGTLFSGGGLAVYRVNAAGTLAWAKSFPTASNYIPTSCVIASDGNLYIAQNISSGGFGLHDACIFRVTPATGAVTAGFRWGGTGNDFVNEIVEGAAGDLYFSGHSDSFGGGFHAYACKVASSTMTLTWQKHLTFVGGEGSGGSVFASGKLYQQFTNFSNKIGLAVYDPSGTLLAADQFNNGTQSIFAVHHGLAVSPDGALALGGASPLVSSWAWSPPGASAAVITGAVVSGTGSFGNYGGIFTTPSGIETTPSLTLDTGGGSQDLLVAKHTVSIGPAPNVQIDATALPNAQFSIWNPTGPTAYTGNLSTNTVFDASTTLYDGDQFYLRFAVDGAAAPNDLVLYPSRLGGSGFVTVTPTGLTLGGSLSTWFTVPAGTRTLQLKPGAYNRITNNMVAGLPHAQYILRDSGTASTIGGPYLTNESNVKNAVLANGVTYQLVFSALTYPSAGSTGSGSAEQIYPTDWPANWMAVGSGTLSEGGASTPGSMRDYFTQAGLVNTMDSDAFVRIELNAAGVNFTPYTLQLSPANTDVTIGMAANPNPRNVANLARGLTFRARNNSGNTTPTFTTDPARLLSGASSVTLNFNAGGGTLIATVLPVRIARDPAGPAWGGAGTITGQSPWSVGINYLLQYGTAPYTIEVDGDYGAAWNDGTAGRVYTVSGSPVSATGLIASTVSFSNHSPGTYNCALRVTDATAATYTFILGNITLPAVGWTPSLPNPDATANNRGKYNRMAIVNGNPAMAYFDFTNDDLMYVRSVDVNGANWGTPVLVSGSGGVDRGWDLDLDVISGNPAISYTGESGAIGGGGCYYKRATDVNGTAWGSEITLAGGNLQYTTMVEANGRPAVAVYNAGGDQLLFQRASDGTGSAWPGFAAIATSSGDWPSMEIVNNAPGIAFYRFGNPAYIHATNPNGSAWGSIVTVDGAGADAGWHNSLAVINGNPAVAYWDQTNGDLRWCRATDVDGLAWGTPAALDTSGMVGDFPSLAQINGRPAITYWDVLNDDLKYLRANDANGATWPAGTAIDNNQCGDWSTLLQVNGQPAVSYYGQAGGGDLRYMRFWP